MVLQMWRSMSLSLLLVLIGAGCTSLPKAVSGTPSRLAGASPSSCTPSDGERSAIDAAVPLLLVTPTVGLASLATGEPAEPPITGQPRTISNADTSRPLILHAFQPASGRVRVVAIDPGHGGPEVGATGAGLAEKDVNLAIALKLRDLLEEDGLRVVLTRQDDNRATCSSSENQGPDGYSATRSDLQCRVDIANDAGADVFLSIHNNGSSDPSLSGTEIWYDGKRPFTSYNAALAESVLLSLVEAVQTIGYTVTNRGLKEDSQFRTYQGRTYPLFVLGPPRSGAISTRATQMPGILGETLFLSNPREAALLKRGETQEAIARGYREGLRRYFRLIDDGLLALASEGWAPEVPTEYGNQRVQP